MNNSSKLLLVTGVGPGTGSAIVRYFASHGYRVAMIARNEKRLQELVNTIPGTFAFPCDVTDIDRLTHQLSLIEQDHGSPDVLIHNAVGGAFGSFMEIEPTQLQHNFEVNTMALLHLARWVTPAMIERGAGSILATGNTSAYRGKAGFAGFAPTKAAQRILLESMARSLGPEGIHVAYCAIDAVIDLPWTRKRYADKPREFFCQPQDIAQECFRLVSQPRSAWSFESVIRPYGESW